MGLALATGLTTNSGVPYPYLLANYKSQYLPIYVFPGLSWNSSNLPVGIYPVKTGSSGVALGSGINRNKLSNFPITVNGMTYNVWSYYGNTLFVDSHDIGDSGFHGLTLGGQLISPSGQFLGSSSSGIQSYAQGPNPSLYVQATVNSANQIIDVIPGRQVVTVNLPNNAIRLAFDINAPGARINVRDGPNGTSGLPYTIVIETESNGSATFVYSQYPNGLSLGNNSTQTFYLDANNTYQQVACGNINSYAQNINIHDLTAPSSLSAISPDAMVATSASSAAPLTTSQAEQLSSHPAGVNLYFALLLIVRVNVKVMLDPAAICKYLKWHDKATKAEYKQLMEFAHWFNWAKVNKVKMCDVQNYVKSCSGDRHNWYDGKHYHYWSGDGQRYYLQDGRIRYDDYRHDKYFYPHYWRYDNDSYSYWRRHYSVHDYLAYYQAKLNGVL